MEGFATRGRRWPHHQVDVLGVGVSVVDEEQLVAWMSDAVDQRRALAVTFANPNYVMTARRDAALRDRINAFDIVLADGWGVVHAARLLGTKLPGRMANDDLTDDIFGTAASRGWRVFLFGSAPDVARTAGDNLSRWYQGLTVVGDLHGYWDVLGGHPGTFDQHDIDTITSTIRAARPDLLIVGVPTPLQQQFVVDHCSDLGVPVIITGGSYLDHLADRRQWYPRWVLAAHAGWLYRLSQDPRRLWRRYTVELAEYAARVVWSAVATSGRRAGPAGRSVPERGEDV